MRVVLDPRRKSTALSDVCSGLRTRLRAELCARRRAGRRLFVVRPDGGRHGDNDVRPANLIVRG